jgi:hypothetical protein
MSEKYSLGHGDFMKGVKVVLFSAAFTVLYSVTQQPDFDVFNTDWAQVGSNLVNVCTITFMSYLSKNFFEGN